MHGAFFIVHCLKRAVTDGGGKTTSAKTVVSQPSMFKKVGLW
jgi:hypothetical protein